MNYQSTSKYVYYTIIVNIMYITVTLIKSHKVNNIENINYCCFKYHLK